MGGAIAKTHVCGQLGGYKPMRNRAAHGFFAFFSCLSAVLGVAAVCAPAWAPEVEPRRTATLSLSLFGVLPCCVFTLIGFAILSAWYGHGGPGEGACNPDLPAAGGTMTCIGFVFLALGASAYYMQGGFDEAQVRRGVVPHGHPPVVAAREAAPPMAPATVVELRRGRSSNPSSSNPRSSRGPGAAHRHGIRIEPVIVLFERRGRKHAFYKAPSPRAGAYAPGLGRHPKNAKLPPTSASSDVTSEYHRCGLLSTTTAIGDIS